MPTGPGKYGKNAEALLKQFGGDWCVILMNGRDGPAFDVATTNPLTLVALPMLLRHLADSIEQEREPIFGPRQ